MPGQLSCKIFRSPKLGEATLRQKLRDYKRTSPEEALHRPLVENVEAFTIAKARAHFTYVYDFVTSIPYRGETQKVVRTVTAAVAIIDPPGENTYYIYARSAVADDVRRRLSIALTRNEDFIENMAIPSARLKNILETEVVELKYGWWDGIDTYARKGALKGNVLKSKYYTAFKKGEPTSITYESKSTGRTVRLNYRGAITIYGQDVAEADVEEYVADVVLGG